MTEFRILTGLPATGDTAIPFPNEFGRLGREGVVVEFAPPHERSWVGNFRPGLTAYSAVFDHPDGEHVLVIAGGHGYFINPVTRQYHGDLGGAVVDAWQDVPRDGILLNNQGISFAFIATPERSWNTRRLSWDGFRNISITADRITGEGWGPKDTWAPFAVDMETGESSGGAFTRPDGRRGERLALKLIP